MALSPLTKASPLSAGMSGASILLYTVWLLLPAVQTTGRAVAGMCCVGLFVVGVLLDTSYLRARWWDMLLRGLLALLLPLVLRFFLKRGTEHFWGYYIQQVMFWFPLLYCAYARTRQDFRLWRYGRTVLLGAMVVTTLTTVGWLVEGMLRDGQVYAYSRSLGFAEPGREAYLKELMQKNIGGYDFIYATVVSLPLTCYGISTARGWRRVGFAAFALLQGVMVALSQYTYALVFTLGIFCVEGMGAFIRGIARRVAKRTLGTGMAMLCTLPLFGGLYLARIPLVGLAAELCAQAGFTSFAYSLEQLLGVMNGALTGEISRLDYYRLPIQGFASSPLVGGLFAGNAPLSQHSDLLDMLSALGLLGALVVGVMVWAMGRGMLKGIGKSPARAHLWLQYAALAACATLGTVVYSRDISLVACLGALLVLEGDEPIQQP